MVRNAVLDLRYGRLLAPVYWHNPAQASSDYGALKRMRFEPVAFDDVLVDVGCGAGRVINYWLSLRLANRMYGVEIDPKLAERTAARLRRHTNVSILTGDAVENLPAQGTVFYLFNPFGFDKMVELEAALRQAAARRPQCRVIYHNPKHLEVFESDGFWHVELVSELGATVGEAYQPVAYLQRADLA